MPFPGAPPGFKCNAPKQHKEEGECTCSSCIRNIMPGLIEGEPVKLHKDFPVDHLVGLYDASVFNTPPPSPQKPMCCFCTMASQANPEDTIWNVWCDVGDPAEMIVQVCSEHIQDALCKNRNVVWPAELVEVVPEPNV